VFLLLNPEQFKFMSRVSRFKFPDQNRMRELAAAAAAAATVPAPAAAAEPFFDQDVLIVINWGFCK
jgi:hypothetical protein